MRSFIPIICLLFAITLPTIMSCDPTPWALDPDCSNLNIASNLEIIKSKELSEGLKDSFKVALVGDPHSHTRSLKKVVDVINRRNDIDFMFLMGDITEGGTKLEFEWTCGILEDLDIPVVSVIGNHDELAFGRQIWEQHLGPTEYSFTYQGTKFIAYNDNKFENTDVPNRDFLANEVVFDSINEDYRLHTLAVSHAPPWDHDLELSAFLKGLGFDYAMHAHIHKFSYWQLSDIELPHYIVAETTGTQFGIMTVYNDSIQFENCSPNCVIANLTNR